MASGHQSRPASARDRVVDGHLGAHAPRSRPSRPSSTATRGPAEPVGDLRAARRRPGVTGVGTTVHGTATGAARGRGPAPRPRSPPGPLAAKAGAPRRGRRRPGSRPHSGASSSATAAAAVGRCRGPAQHGPGAPGQDVVDGHGHLVAHRPHRLHPEVGQARRPAARAARAGPRPARARPGSRRRGGPRGRRRRRRRAPTARRRPGAAQLLEARRPPEGQPLGPAPPRPGRGAGAQAAHDRRPRCPRPCGGRW